MKVRFSYFFGAERSQEQDMDCIRHATLLREKETVGCQRYKIMAKSFYDLLHKPELKTNTLENCYAF